MDLKRQIFFFFKVLAFFAIVLSQTGFFKTSFIKSSDRTPDSFSFSDVTNASPNVVVTSNAVTISGIDVAVPVSVSGEGGPQVRIENGAWGSGGMISDGQTLSVRLTSANASLTMRTALVDVGGVSDQFSVTTELVCMAGAYAMDGYCFYYGGSNQDCNQVCSSRGGCNQPGLAYISGSAPDHTRCQTLLTYFRGGNTNMQTASVPGCLYNSAHPPGKRGTSSTCTGKHSNYRRVCACNN